MFVGYLRRRENPGKMARLMAMLCKASGFELLYFTPKDVQSDGTIEGKMYLHEQWIPVTADIPAFIDVNAYLFRNSNRKVLTLLNERSKLSDNRLDLGRMASSIPYLVSKEMMNDALAQYDHIKDYLIPTDKVIEFATIEEALETHGKIVLKPTNGLQGKGIYLVTKASEEEYQVEYLKETSILHKAEFESLYEEVFSNNRYVVQKYIRSRTQQGDPFDCRIHLEKNGSGNWRIIKKVIRIGIGQKVISNVNQGGGVSDCKAFLAANFGEKATDINNRLNVLGKSVAPKVEEVRGVELMMLGLDVGISSEGELYLFEANGDPVTSFAPVDIALSRVAYYKYMIGKQ